jgi:hypothetical protein
MKTIICLACLAALTLIESGCYTSPPPVSAQSPPVGPAPQAVVTAEAPSMPPPPPPPAVAEAPLAPAPPPPTGYVTYAPEYYTWDGNEYVGVSNGQYVYWTGGAWIVAPPAITFRFRGWARYHPDWHRHAVPYRRHY